MTQVLFLCYGNSCRSQMAEAWARHYGRGIVRAQSAGLAPLGYITQETERVMAERGISLDGQFSKGLDEVDLARVDVVVNLSGTALEGGLEKFSGKYLDWPVADPFQEPMDFYRRVRDEIEQRVQKLIAEQGGRGESRRGKRRNRKKPPVHL